jgi:hypothetical protein
MLKEQADRACRKAARLISESQDHRLRLRDRLALRVHLAMCDGCTRYLHQIEFLGRAMKRWSNYSEEP